MLSQGIKSLQRSNWRHQSKQENILPCMKYFSTFGVRSYRSQELCKRRFLYYLYIWCIVYPSTRVQFLNCSHYHKNTFTTFLHNISKHRFSFQCDIFSCISNSNISIQKTYITLTSLKAKMLNKFAFFIR